MPQPPAPIDIPWGCLPIGAFGPSATDTDLLCLFKDWSCLCTRPDGAMPDEPLAAFTSFGTRLVADYQFRLNGSVPQSTLCTPLGSSRWTGLFVLPPPGKSAGRRIKGTRPPGSLGLRVLRSIDGGWCETLNVEPYGSAPRRVRLELSWSSPLDDVEMAQAMRSPRDSNAGKGLVPRVVRSRTAVSLKYRHDYGPRRRAPALELLKLFGEDAPRNGVRIVRGLRVQIDAGARGAEAVKIQPGNVTRVRISARLRKGEALTLTLRFAPEIDGAELDVPVRPHSRPLPRRSAAPPQGTTILCGNPTLDLILRQAETDVRTMKLGLTGPEAVAAGTGSVLLAGVPRYVGIFTRDALLAAHHAAILSPEGLDEALERTAAYQGVRFDPWRDEEPGRLHHERRLDPESCLGRRNRELYYGDSLGTPYWIHLLLEAFRWSGNRELISRHSGTLRRASEWLNGKLDEGGGLLFYKSRSRQGNVNQGWKDSEDAIVDRKGKPLDAPLATVELQAYAYRALLEGARAHDLLGEPTRARLLRGRAVRLKAKFNNTFWDADSRFFALAVDGKGRRANSITSNPGHCLGSGLIDGRRTDLVVQRLGRPDLFSGWGIRTLSSANPSYDPFSYHRGSVWPVDNACIARTLRQAGEDDLALRVIGAQVAAATCFPRMRLPETLSGHPRSEEHPAPGLYPDSNLLQAWSVTALFSFIQTLLGLRPRADQSVLLLDPALPDWLPWVRLKGLRLGNGRLDLHFWRDGAGRSHARLLGRNGNIRIVRRPFGADSR